MIERIVMLGFMCSGKSTVGASLARRLEWGFIDFDVEIERREGRPVASIIQAAGEEYFRGAEAALTREVSGMRGLVLAPGGGWIMQPELLEAIRPGTLSVWLSASVEETVRRLRSDEIDRPFRDHPDPSGLVAALMADRAMLLDRADLKVPVDGRTVEQTAFEIEQLVRSRGVLLPSL